MRPSKGDTLLRPVLPWHLLPNHQTLIVAAMGMSGHRRRQFPHGPQSLALEQHRLPGRPDSKISARVILWSKNRPSSASFMSSNSSIIAYFWFSILTRETFPEFCLDAAQTCLAFAGPQESVPAIFLGPRRRPLVASSSSVGHPQDGRKWLVVLGLGVAGPGALFLLLYAPRGHTNRP